jgi:hypothetical protein
VLCRNLHLFDEASVAIDGSKFKAVNARDKNFTHDRLKRRIATIDNKIERYLLLGSETQKVLTHSKLPVLVHM